MSSQRDNPKNMFDLKDNSVFDSNHSSKRWRKQSDKNHELKDKLSSASKPSEGYAMTYQEQKERRQETLGNFAEQSAIAISAFSKGDFDAFQR